jgi:hypothetical protein
VEACKGEPKVVTGWMATMFNPFSFTKSHAAFSASVLDKKYHIYNKHIVIMNPLKSEIIQISKHTLKDQD